MKKKFEFWIIFNGSAIEIKETKHAYTQADVIRWAAENGHQLRSSVRPA